MNNVKQVPETMNCEGLASVQPSARRQARQFNPEQVGRMICNDWRTSPEPIPRLSRDIVHVWRVNLPQESELPWRSLLSLDERQRGDRFHFDADRIRFTVTRGVLRTLLGQYFDAAPQALSFRYNEFGKPSLDLRHDSTEIHFNVSHSGGCSLLAFSVGAPLGVDVEHLAIERDIENVARMAFSPDRYESFLLLPKASRKKSFFEAWTCQEALAKALGCGLFMAVDSQTVDNADSSEWFIRSIKLDAEYAAAIALKARNVHLHFWKWTGPG
jgi:4'-phosphopantetheinyl transferase